MLGVGDADSEEMTFARDVRIAGWMAVGETYIGALFRSIPGPRDGCFWQTLTLNVQCTTA